ncbi:carbohydrate esterase family 3 protein [Hypoxylon trugodes]|uniref:carbohydrate esterase family 3 protein n=1 Tax=Hypoxylon trugodes TaxID=326681 RepID=UPI0021978908|nr:carbohydrate esterase family 3 protein [Hypoxylon trugodes]KAI1390057.1 carbohydrate esterase family 3 protein [Hypoxylon trugodes]
MAWENMEKGSQIPATASRWAFIRTKKAIAAFTVLGCGLIAAIVVITLTATGKLHGSGSSIDSTSGEHVASMISSTPTVSVATATPTTGIDDLISTASTMPTAESSSTSKPTSVSTSTSTSTSTSSESATESATPSVVAAASKPSDVPLRIMALGASIIKGETSPGYLGFRKPMRDELVKTGYTVNMVGSVRLGDFTDNDVEAYGGKKILEMHNYAKKAVPKYLPNVFVINLGTNNLLQNKDVDKVGKQMEDLINYLLTASSKSTVILSTMLTNKVANMEPKVLDMNRQYRDIMKGFEAAKKSVVLAEMHPSEGIAGVPTADEIGPDGSHPTVSGYEKMGRIFVQAIQQADKKGLLHKASDNGIPADGDKERSG